MTTSADQPEKGYSFVWFWFIAVFCLSISGWLFRVLPRAQLGEPRKRPFDFYPSKLSMNDSPPMLSISDPFPSVAVQNRGANLRGDGCFQEFRQCVP